MKKLIISILLYHLNICAFAQNDFKKIIECGYCYPSYATLANDTLIGRFRIINAAMNYQKIDSLGLVSFERNFNDSTNSPGVDYNAQCFIVNGEILISNWEYFPSASINIKTVIKLDYNGNIIFKKKYDFPAWQTNTLAYYSNIILSGGTQYDVPAHTEIPYLAKLDTAGNLIWSKKLQGVSGKICFAFALNDFDYLVGLELHAGCGASLCKVDSSGHVLWSKSYMRPVGKFYSYNLNNNLITLIGNVDTDGTGTNAQAVKFFFLQVDTAGAIITSKQLGDTLNSILPGFPSYTAKIKPTNDNGFIITSATKYGNRLGLIKTDSTGNIQWTRSHGADPTLEYGSDVIQTPDGGFLALGGTLTNLQGFNKYYLVKTDSLGFTGCQETSDTIPVATLNITDSIITITDSAFTVNTYTSTVHDTIMPPAQVMDGCTLGGWHEISVFNKSKLLSYPNPTQGQFQIKTGSTNAYMVTVTVYDTKGVQLFEKKYRNAADVKLDLTGYGKGVYSIRIVDNKTTRWSKVVVE